VRGRHPAKMIWLWVGGGLTIMTTIMNTIMNEKDYDYILGKIWNNELEDLKDVVLPPNFLYEVATMNRYWDWDDNKPMYLGDEDAVVWYLENFSPDVFCEEFMDTFFDVEEEVPDYNYRDWKANPKFLLFASYINSCGGIDEWNWYKVFSGIDSGVFGPRTTADGGEFGEDGKELFSCSDWLKRKPCFDWKKLKN
jgi:hypothetical protein